MQHFHITRHLVCLSVFLWLCYLSTSRGTLTVLDTDQSFLAYNFPLASPEDSQTFQGRMIPGKVGPDCKLLVNTSLFPGEFNVAENSDTNVKTVLLIDHSKPPSAACSLARDVLTHNHDLSFPVDVFVFVSPFSYPYDFGGIDEPYFIYYKEGLPVKQDLLVIGNDTALALQDIFTGELSSDGLRIAVQDTVGPWNRYLHSDGYRAIRWIFVVLRALFLLYAVTHIFLMVRSGKFGGIFKKLLYFVILINIVVSMIGPHEVLFYHANFYMELIAWSAINIVYFMLLYQWGTVVYRSYGWGWFRIHYVVLFVYIPVFIVWFTAMVMDISDAGRQGAGATYVILGRYYIPFVILFLLVSSYFGVATWVIIHQRRLERVGEGIQSLIQLTKLCMFSIAGWTVVGIALVLIPTVFNIPTVSRLIALCMLYQIGGIWITFAVFWQLSITGISPISKFLSQALSSSSRPAEPIDDCNLDLQHQSLGLNHLCHGMVENEKRSFNRPSFSREDHIGMEALNRSPLESDRYPRSTFKYSNDLSTAALIQDSQLWPDGKPQGLSIPDPARTGSSVSSRY